MSQFKKVQVQLVDPAGQPIVGAFVGYDESAAGGWKLGGLTDAQGYWRFNTVEVGHTPAVVSASATGYVSWQETLPVPANADWSYRRTLDKAPSTPHLEVRGNDFVDAQGHFLCHSGVDAFQAFRFFLDGRLAELEALAAEAHEFGFQWWRVMMMGSKAQNTLFDLSPNEPAFYPNVRPFADWMNAHGLGLLAEVYADNQDVQAPVPGHWQTMANLLRGSTTILSGGNEHDKNGFDPQLLTDPGMIWSRGSGGADSLTPQNGATCASFHQRTDWPATINDAVASRVFMRDNGYTVLLMDEPTRFDDTSNKSGVPDSERFAFELARIYGGLWGMAVFHNFCGQRCIPLTPNLRRVAAAWQRGLKV